ncbi:MAG: hypothetical protein WAU11_16990 [Ignavibacteriaceae bacterium]
MASISEKSFGQRYTKGRELVEYLKLLPTYTPGNTDLEATSLTTLLDNILTANSGVASKISSLQTERDARLTMYVSQTGLINKCGQIRDYIASIEPKGKKAVDYKKVRGKRLTPKPKPPEAGATAPKKVSTSEVSFGSVLSTAFEILEVIKGNALYAPSNTALTVANFTTLLNSIDAKNKLIAQKREEWDDAVEDRMSLYTDLQSRVTKTKLALASQFGKTSNEYKDSVKF